MSVELMDSNIKLKSHITLYAKHYMKWVNEHIPPALVKFKPCEPKKGDLKTYRENSRW